MAKTCLTLIALLTLSIPTGYANESMAQLPQFKLLITPENLHSTKINVDGTVSTSKSSLQFVLMPWHSYKFDSSGKSIELSDGSKFNFPDSSLSHIVHFSGSSNMQAPKYFAGSDEIYCLNNSVPNPEVMSDGSYYDVQFQLPDGYSALVADKDVVQQNGLEFQIAKFGKAIIRKADKMTVKFIFPQGFTANEKYLEFIREQVQLDIKLFGRLPFNAIKVGAIRRGGSEEINGNPSGNLILFSRTALGDPVHLLSPAKMGISEDISDPLRKLIVAHELAHFWFGGRYQGQDGWMQEGLPQFFGLLAAIRSSSPAKAEALKSFFYKMAKNGPKAPIVNSKFSEDEAGYLKSYFQAPVALLLLSEEVGEDKLTHFLLSVYEENSNPKFADFDQKFRAEFPASVSKWREVWQLDAKDCN